MAGIATRVTLDDSHVRALMQKFARHAENMAPALESMGEYMLVQTDKRFTGEHDPEGKPWAPLKLRTIYGSHRGKKYTKKGQLTKRFATYVARRKILTASGGLRGSIVYRVGRGHVVIGTNKIYGRVHQEGAEFSIVSRRARIRIPARPYLGVNADDRREFAAIVKEHLLSGLDHA